MRDAYVWCDALLGEVMAKLPEETTLLVVSDHGFGPAYLGISKARVLADLAANGRGVATSRNLFGGDFYLEDKGAEGRARVAAALSALADDSDQPLVRAVHDTRSVEHRGWGADVGPDLVAEEAEGFLFVPGEAKDPLVVPLPRTAFSGYHRRAGFFAARGRQIVPGEVRDCSLPDVPALALHLLGEGIPRRYTQNVPRRLFPPEHFLKRPMEYVGRPQDGLRKPGAATLRPDPAVEEQLRGLGYVN